MQTQRCIDSSNKHQNFYEKCENDFYFSGHKAKLLIKLAWGLSALFASPFLALFKEEIVEGLYRKNLK